MIADRGWEDGRELMLSLRVPLVQSACQAMYHHAAGYCIWRKGRGGEAHRIALGMSTTDRHG